MLAKLAFALGVFSLAAAGLACGQDLKRRIPESTDQLRQIYETPAYDAAYRKAQEHYNLSRGEPAWVPVVWDSHRQMVWLQATQQELLRFAREAAVLGSTLDALALRPDVRANAEKLAPIRQIEDQFTKDCVTDLDEMVLHLDLVTLFRGNKMPGEAAAWVTQPVPAGRNTGKIDLVSDFANHLTDLLGSTTRTHTIFARSASFNPEPLLDEKGNELSRKDYLIYWRTDTSAVVQHAMVKLYWNLQQAKTAASDQRPSASTPTH